MSTVIENSQFIVIFRPQNNLPFSSLLKRHYRHCWVYIKTTNGWFLINPLRNELFIKRHQKLETSSIVGAYSSKGYTVVVGNRHKINRSYELPTCVGVTKRLIGISSIWVQTPYQLFKFLQRM